MLAIIGPAEAVPARGVRVAQPLHRRRRPRADRARSREQGRHARGARPAEPRVTRPSTLANEQAFARRTAPEDQRPRQPRDGDLLVAPVGDDAAAAGPARAGRAARARAGSTPSATGPRRSRSTRRSRRTSRRSSTRTATSPSIPGEEQRAWELAATAVKKDARVFVIADSDWFDDEAIQVPGNGVLALDVIHWLMGDEAFSGADLDRGRRDDHPHPQAGRRLVLLDDLPRPGAGDRRGRRASRARPRRKRREGKGAAGAPPSPPPPTTGTAGGAS